MIVYFERGQTCYRFKVELTLLSGGISYRLTHEDISFHGFSRDEQVSARIQQLADKLIDIIEELENEPIR